MYRKCKGEYMFVCLQQGASYAPVLGYRSSDDQIVSKLALRTLIGVHTSPLGPENHGATIPPFFGLSTNFGFRDFGRFG